MESRDGLGLPVVWWADRNALHARAAQEAIDIPRQPAPRPVLGAAAEGGQLAESALARRLTLLARLERAAAAYSTRLGVKSAVESWVQRACADLRSPRGLSEYTREALEWMLALRKPLTLEASSLCRAALALAEERVDEGDVRLCLDIASSQAGG